MLRRLLNKIKCTKTYLCKSWEYKRAFIHTAGNAYRVTITYNGKRTTFVFHDNLNNTSSKKDFLYCLWLDGTAYDNARDVYEFAREYGYDSITEARKVYNACKKQSEALHRLFNEQEIDILSTIE